MIRTFHGGGFQSERERSLMQITAPLNDGRQKEDQGHHKVGLKNNMWAKIGLLDPEKLDQTMDSEIKVEDKLSPV